MRHLNLLDYSYGKLYVIKRDGCNIKGEAKWLCQCGCGQTTTATTYDLTSGHKKSCGCLRAIKSVPAMLLARSLVE